MLRATAAGRAAEADWVDHAVTDRVIGREEIAVMDIVAILELFALDEQWRILAAVEAMRVLGQSK